ncbi:GDSL family lipase [Pseudalgibacter alginicilyticus]|uniref:GDSL family lipase n=1 Tax=Pseudalgibacter alginicilyticus TaxID=1736674 RepID=A0A0P0DF64_9FLAO|nr:arylesterase [Pseudalgibacter alginicilyticus]ALJ06769.1 GDSL family lipase [Pseudalgibacter alginicilyticus]
MRILLMLCYFLIFSVNISCKERNNKNVEDSVESIEVENSQEGITTKNKIILFFGDSLTAGMGLDTEEAFPALIQDKLDSLQLSYQVINAGLSGETTAGGKNRIAWVLKQKIDVFVLELGANDGLRGVPPSETRRNLQAIIDIVNEKNPETKIILAGMQIPPNLGVDYTTEFKNIFPELAAENNLKLIPFLLEDVAGIPALNQNDGIHPTAEGQKIVAQNVWSVLKEVVL